MAIEAGRQALMAAWEGLENTVVKNQVGLSSPFLAEELGTQHLSNMSLIVWG